MGKKVIWAKEVYQDLEDIAEYIAVDSPYYASQFIKEVLQTGKTLENLAQRGRHVPEINDTDIHEIFIKEYRLIYKIDRHQVIILALIHGRRDLKRLWKKQKRNKK